MMDFYRNMTEWAMYNWENFRVFYLILGCSGIFLGMMIWEFIHTIMDEVHK